MTETIKEIDPEKGDIVRHRKSGIEYVFYAHRERPIPEGIVHYPVFLMEEPDGKLSRPYNIIGGFDDVEFIERGPAREPGQKPARPLIKPTDPDRGTIKP